MTTDAMLPFSAEVNRRIMTMDKLQFYEGPVRSGKTLASLISLLLYIEGNDTKRGIISGYSVGSVIRNCVKSEKGLLELSPRSRLVMRDNAYQVLVPTTHGEVTIYIFGADDASSDGPLRGMSIDFWYADEITKHHINFINEAMARSAASDRPFMVWTSNPDNPNNRIYTEYTDKFLRFTEEEDRTFGGYHEFHFKLEDNPIMTPEKIERLKLNYTGVEYRRKILGERCVAEGLVYPDVDDRYFRDIDAKDVDVRYCAIDFGTDHPTVMLFGGMFKGNRRDWRIVDEYCDEKSGKTTYDYYADFLGKCREIGIDPNGVTIAIDPAAKVLRLEFMRHGLTVVKAKNDVLDGINYTRNAIHRGLLSFGPKRKMRRLASELGTYSWDPKASERGEDKPVKIIDDACDAMRYFAYTFVRPVTGE